MTEHKNIPALTSGKNVLVARTRHGTLIGRGLAALHEWQKIEMTRRSQDERYRDARRVFDQDIMGSEFCELLDWNQKDNPELFYAFTTFQQLATECYGKAYFPLSILFGGNENIDESKKYAEHFAEIAFEWCLTRKDNQDEELWSDLGMLYSLKPSKEKDETRIIREQSNYWLRKAAEQGHALGQYKTGFHFCRIHDFAEAVKWYQLAAAQGVVAAQFELGMLYDDEQYARKNFEESAKWYRLAADRGHEVAQYFLGMKILSGEGVPQDIKEGIKRLRLVAEQGNSHAQYSLGYLFHKGHGVDKNESQAVIWYQLAAAQGDVRAQEELTKIGVD